MSDGFQHITVTPEPEEDTVIYAGLRAARDRSAVDEDQDAAAGGRALEGQEAALADAAEAADTAHAGAASDAEEDLTLVDLESPMPLKQRIVIIAVVICLIGAIVYCLAFMR